MSETARTTSNGPTRLRVGLVLDRLEGPAWFGALVQAVREGGDAELVSLRITGAAADAAAPSGQTLLRLYDLVDGRVFGRPRDPTDCIDLTGVLSGIPALDANSVTSPPDVALRLGSRPAAEGPVRERLGEWTIRHGYGLAPGLLPERLGLAPGGPEMLTGRPITISCLVATEPDGGQRAIGQVVSSVDRLSLRRGARGHLQKLPGLVARSLRAARLDGALPTGEENRSQQPSHGRASLGIGQIVLALAGIVAGFVGRRILRFLAPERWVVVVSRHRSGAEGIGPSDRRDLTILEAPSGCEWADPFPVATPDGDLVFIEEYVRARHRGRLAVVELDESPRGWRTATPILDQPTHLSYPFVFRWEDDWYLLPEQARTGSLELYRADAFPYQWRWHSTALEGVPAADATIAQIDGVWWLFAAVAIAPGIAADELHLFHSSSPLGPWTAHGRNPVVSDVRTARPAGRLFERDGRWYRPAQNGAITYGHSISIVQIERIDLDGYRERVIQTIRPSWLPSLIATHTLNTDEHLLAIDGLVREPRIRRTPPAPPALHLPADRRANPT